MRDVQVVLDTSYILPFFGIDVEIPELKKSLKKIFLTEDPKFIISLSTCSFIEAKWVLLSEYRQSKDARILNRFRVVLKSLIGNPQILIHYSVLDEIANIVADDLRIAGLTDVMDGWITGAAYSLQCPLVTEDQELKKIISQTKYKDKLEVISWGKILEQYGLLEHT